MMKTLLYLTLFVLSIAFWGCGGKQCINPRNKWLGKSTEQLLGDAKNKSWWLYAKENTSLQDSIYLENFSQDIEHLRDAETCDDKEVISYELVGQGIFCNRAKVKIEALSTADLASFECSEGMSLFNFLLYKDKNDKFESNNWVDFEVLPTYTVLGVEYEDVIKVYQKGFDVNGVEGQQQKQIRYFAPKIGLIRLENIADAQFSDNSVYNLVKYGIKY